MDKTNLTTTARAPVSDTQKTLGLFWGEDDRIIPIVQGEAFSALLENCTLHRFRGAGHFLHWERPHELAASLLEYLDAPAVPRARLRSTERSADRGAVDQACRSAA